MEVLENPVDYNTSLSYSLTPFMNIKEINTLTSTVEHNHYILYNISRRVCLSERDKFKNYRTDIHTVIINGQIDS